MQCVVCVCVCVYDTGYKLHQLRASQIKMKSKLKRKQEMPWSLVFGKKKKVIKSAK